MSGSREESLDWLRSFQPPTQPAIDLSSGSESPLNQSPISDDEDNINLSRLFKKEAKLVSDIKDHDDAREIESDNPFKGKSPNKGGKVKQTPERKRKNNDASEGGKRDKQIDTSKGNTPEKLGKSRYVKKSKVNKKVSASKDLEAGNKKEDDLLIDPDVESLKNRAPKVTSPERKLEKEDDKSFNDDSLLDHDVKSLKNQTSKVKSPVGKLEKEDEKSFKEKNIISSINGGSGGHGQHGRSYF